MLVGFFAIVGALLGSKLIWIQFFAKEQVLGCMANIEQIFNFYSWKDAARIILRATSCSEENFTILMVPLSIWTLFVFIVLFIMAISALVKYNGL